MDTFTIYTALYEEGGCSDYQVLQVTAADGDRAAEIGLRAHTPDCEEGETDVDFVCYVEGPPEPGDLVIVEHADGRMAGAGRDAASWRAALK